MAGERLARRHRVDARLAWLAVVVLGVAVFTVGLARVAAGRDPDVRMRRWLGVTFRHLALDLGADDALQLLAAARRTDPRDVTNLVLPGRGGMAGAQSVVYLDAEAAGRIADDLRPDAAIGPAKPHPTTTTTQPPATTTSTPPPGPPAAAP